jgi:Ran GTPase-activating protein (RanGAP) involved in mRNA processing and transport
MNEEEIEDVARRFQNWAQGDRMAEHRFSFGTRAVVDCALDEAGRTGKLTGLRGTDLFDYGAGRVAEFLTGRAVVSEVDLSCSAMGSGGALVVVRAIAKGCPAVRSLAVVGGRIGAWEVVAEAIAACKSLTQLNVSSNTHSTDEAAHIAALARALPALTSLNISYNSVGAETAATVLAEAITLTTALTRLDVSYCQIGDDGATAIGQALAKNGTIAQLNLRGNSIKWKGAEAIAAAVRTNIVLERLNMGSNNLTDRGVQALAEAIVANSTITDLRIADCGLGSGLIVADMLRANRSLTYLNVANNKLGPAGFEQIMEALEGNRTLTRLNAANTAIHDLLAVKDAIEATRLRRLDIDQNGFGIIHIKHFVGTSLIYNVHLRFIALSEARGKFDGPAAVAELMEVQNHAIADHRRSVQQTMTRGLHPRLGADSPISVCCQDWFTLRLITETFLGRSSPCQIVY